SAIADSLKRAEQANIPVITLNSGEKDFGRLGAITHVGQDEIVAGQGAGSRFKSLSVKKLLILVHEQGNVGLEQRFSGAKATFGGNVTRLQVTGVKDLATTQNEIRSKLQADKSIDAILGLNPQVGYTAFQAAQSVKSTAKVATFDLSTDVLKSIQNGGMLFAIDQRVARVGLLSHSFRRPAIGSLVGVVAVFALFSITASGFAGLDGLARWSDEASNIGIMAVPVALLMIGGEFDLSAGVMSGSAGLLFAYLVTHGGWNVWPALVIVLLFGMTVGLLNGALVTKTGLPSFIVTLGTFFSLEGLNLGLTQHVTGT